MRVTHRKRDTYPHCTPAPHDKTLLELEGIGIKSTRDQFCNAIREYIDGKTELSAEAKYNKLKSLMGMRHVIA